MGVRGKKGMMEGGGQVWGLCEALSQPRVLFGGQVLLSGGSVGQLMEPSL